MNDRLYRSRDDRVLAGVCGGIADYFDVDPSVVRILYALVAVLSGIFPLLILYIIMVIVVPEEPLPGTFPPGPGWGPAGTWGATPGWGQPGTTPGTTGGTAGGAEGTADSGATEGAAGGPAAASPDATGAAGTSGGAGTAWGGTPGGPAYADWRSQRAAWRAQRREMRAAWRAQRRAYGSNTGAIVIGLLLVILGAWFFLQQAIPSLNAGWFWPVVLILGGVMLLAGSLRAGGSGHS